MKIFSSLTRKHTSVKAHVLSWQTYSSATCPFPVLCLPSSHMLYPLCYFQNGFLASLVSTDLIFHAYPLPPSLNVVLYSCLNNAAQYPVKLVAFWGASWKPPGFQPSSSLCNFCSVISFSSILSSFLCHSFGLFIFKHFLWEWILTRCHLVRCLGESFKFYTVGARQRKCFCFRKAVPQGYPADLDICERTTDS